MIRRRLRKFILITGTSLSLLIATAFVVSGWHLIGVQVTGQGPAVGVTEGCCFFTRSSPLGGTPIVARIPIDYLAIPTSTLPRQRMPNWELCNLWDVVPGLMGAGEGIFIPLYALFLAIALPTLLVWRLAPKFPRGHCRRCGYNLKGNTSGVCPECGERID